MVFRDWVSRSMPESSSASNISDSSAFAVLRVFVAVVVHFLVLEPATAWLTPVEVSCLNDWCETLVYDYGKGKFVRAGLVLAGLARMNS